MVGPLIGDAQWHFGDLAVFHVAEAVCVLLTWIVFIGCEEFARVELLPRLQFADRIFGQYHHTERAYGFRNAMVDFRIDMVRAACEYDASAVVFLHVGECLEAFHLHIVLEDFVFGICRFDCNFGFFTGHVGPGEFFDDAVDHEFMVGHVEVWAHVADAFFAQFGHVRADDHGIVGYHRAIVVVVGVGYQVLFVADARVEDVFHTLVQQPFDVSVHKFGRIANVFGCDGFDASFEQFVRASSGNHHFEAERGEQCEPERIVLVHVEYARNADFAAGCFLVGESAVGEATLVLVIVEVRSIGTLLFRVSASLAAVTGHVTGSVLEGGDGELAVVLAQLAHVSFGGHRQVVEFFSVQNVRCGMAYACDHRFFGVGGIDVFVFRFVGIVHACGQCGTVCAHESCDVRSGHFTFCEQFECAEHSVVEERAALHHHSVAEFAGITQFDHLVEGVAHYGIAQACGDIFDGCAFLLRLLHGRVHEHGASGAQIDRMGRVERRLGEFLNGQSHGNGECLQERSAAGRACFVHCDGVDHAIVDGEIFHVLAADIDDGGDARAYHFGTAIVSHGFHYTFVKMQAGGDEAFAIAGRAGSCDPCAFGEFGLDFFDDLHGCRQRAAFVGRVRGPYDFAIVVHQCRFDGGGTGVDAQEVRSLGSFERALMDMLAMMSFVECGAIRFGSEQRRHGRGVGRQVFQFVQSRQKVGTGSCFVMLSQGRHHPDRPAMQHRMPRTGERRSEQ